MYLQYAQVKYKSPCNANFKSLHLQKKTLSLKARTMDIAILCMCASNVGLLRYSNVSVVDPECFSGFRIPDLNFFDPGSRIRIK
jgi:hypothetical protein